MPEPAHEGVDDYTRLLPAQLSKLGLVNNLLALYDKGVAAITAEGRITDGVGRVTLRIPRHVGDTDWFVLLQGKDTMANPTWVSLQVVLYSLDEQNNLC